MNTGGGSWLTTSEWLARVDQPLPDGDVIVSLKEHRHRLKWGVEGVKGVEGRGRWACGARIIASRLAAPPYREAGAVHNTRATCDTT
ncbi:hypothetical protein E2C01_068964 [Portunus trituberculatus]|uniref:Uncharacterized protein n=1 Tax=Portunus trituberculatus TaxID=210409 RepID=A0A5B7I0X7_PORTR|nr:hypothetical protein [Portunus trituberculatus]